MVVKKFFLYLQNNFKKMDIKSGNVIIAKFMGWKIDNSFPDKGRVWRSNGSIELDTTFKFHSDWNKLIPAIEKLITLHEKSYYGIFQWFDAHGVIGLEDAWQKVINAIGENYGKQKNN